MPHHLLPEPAPIGSALDERPHSAVSSVLCVGQETAAIAQVLSDPTGPFSFVTAPDGAQALALVDRGGEFAAIVTGLGLPDMSATEFLERVSSLSPTTARVVWTPSEELTPLAFPPDLAFRVLDSSCPPEALRAALRDSVTYHTLLASSPAHSVRVLAGGLRPLDEATVTAPRDARAELPRGLPLQPLPELPSSRGGRRIGLRSSNHTVELLPGVTLVGRSRSCHIALDDPRVSRRHVCLSYDERGLTVRNVSSTNALLLNGKPAGSAAHTIAVGDRISVGGHELEVCQIGDYRPSLEPTERFRLDALDSELPGEPEPMTFAEIVEVAQKYSRLGMVGDAERVLRPALQGLLRHSQCGQAVLPRDVTLAVEAALGFAEVKKAGAWINYVFELLTSLEQPPDHAELELLYRIVPTAAGIRMQSYRGYVDVLLRCPERYGPGRRFLIRRVQGLEGAVLRSAHV